MQDFTKTVQNSIKFRVSGKSLHGNATNNYLSTGKQGDQTDRARNEGESKRREEVRRLAGREGMSNGQTTRRGIRAVRVSA